MKDFEQLYLDLISLMCKELEKSVREGRLEGVDVYSLAIQRLLNSTATA